jgi:hypothetical protein
MTGAAPMPAACWYHGADRPRVRRVALSAIRHPPSAIRHPPLRFARAGEPEPDLVDDDALRAAVQTANKGNLTGWGSEALASLFLEPVDVSREEGDSYANGRHLGPRPS